MPNVPFMHTEVMTETLAVSVVSTVNARHFLRSTIHIGANTHQFIQMKLVFSHKNQKQNGNDPIDG